MFPRVGKLANIRGNTAILKYLFNVSQSGQTENNQGYVAILKCFYNNVSQGGQLIPRSITILRIVIQFSGNNSQNCYASWNGNSQIFRRLGKSFEFIH